ncbi:leucine-rich repeat receptor protein kinase EMS1-like [Impatiens glandulifera]|uniref:leucine-rich repeat receptor protein kinase EMS1-like n=1 Tax=Impatiens glandulifera TaxID=253017 RepID=UPI001FB19661|nr:leucine-rich repeat receptor protein kinase EMS1-like [Impatiens glandulifera]
MDPIFQAVIAAMACFFVLTLTFIAIYIACGKRNKRQSRQIRGNRIRTIPNPDLSSVAVTESALFDPSLNQISMHELVQATQDFSKDRIVGDGSFGLVYKAQLRSGVTVAVKKLSADAFQGYREFRAEMETLGKLRHHNIVKMLGYCSTGCDRVLIYEFIEKGSLDQWLYDTSSETDFNSPDAVPWSPLPWSTRIKVMKGVANGLSHMHNLEVPIIHRDIKASNVLLDSEFESHIADFGLARRIEGTHSHVSTQVAGTMGYMPPEYIHGATTATAMGDIYSFGVLMLEVATGIRPHLTFKVREDEKEVRLVDWARKMAEMNREMEMLDGYIVKEGLSVISVVEYFRIANMCTDETPRMRPLMRDIVDLLDQITVTVVRQQDKEIEKDVIMNQHESHLEEV